MRRAGECSAIDPPELAARPRIAWSLAVEGRVERLLAAGGMLFAVTREGRIMAFGADQGKEKTWSDASRRLTPARRGRADRVRAAAPAEPRPREGYALWFAADDEPLLEAVLAASELHVVVVDSDADRVARLRRRLRCRRDGTAAAWRSRGRPAQLSSAPRYMASLIVVGRSLAERLANNGALGTVYESLRPYGGRLWVPADDAAALQQRFRAGRAGQGGGGAGATMP